jgi:hypothetical protein
MGPDAISPRTAAGRTEGGGASWAPACAAVVLFVLIWLDGRGRTPVGNMDVHYARIRELADASIRNCVGDWIGKIVPAPPSVEAMLKPNKLQAVEYVNYRTGESADVLFVHCGDARDLVGHYPPVCYPAHGQPLKSSQTRDWTIGRATITGMRYRFEGSDGPFGPETVVDNFMVLPNGRFGRDMDAATHVAWDRRLRRFGEAEVQVVTKGEMSDARRDEVFQDLMRSAMPLFDCVRNEVNGD